ncbi:MAG: RluA family pseudouridine synthase [Defluviitaleaceae bacterium]|nr:RluA family pseudouridine synthase [Defluviitaleaceae bacterium]
MVVEITAENAGRRLDKFLFAYFNNVPHSFIYKMLRKKRIKLNGGRAMGNELLQAGDELRFYLSPETIESSRKPRIFDPAPPLTDIIFEDENLLVVNKPAGLPSQGGMKERPARADHLLARILYYLQEKGGRFEDFTPAICNRLDVNTSGLVICGKTLHALQTINAAFANREVDKEYTAIVHGVMGSPGDSKTLEGFYHKDPHSNIATIFDEIACVPKGGATGTLAITSYTVLATAKDYTLLSVKPITGRSHQIRAHLASIGHPLAGDKKYGGKPTPYAPAQLLHCRRMEAADLPYAASWEAPLPQGLQKCLREWFV